MKILSLDLGDKWVGSAISDALGITCRPYKTVKIEDLIPFLEKVLPEENVGIVVVGRPTTLKGKESEQTLKIIEKKEELEKQFCSLDHRKVEWILWDERLSSKRAAQTMGKKYRTKEAKIDSHSIAAAFILQSYLDHLAFSKE